MNKGKQADNFEAENLQQQLESLLSQIASVEPDLVPDAAKTQDQAPPAPPQGAPADGEPEDPPDHVQQDEPGPEPEPAHPGEPDAPAPAADGAGAVTEPEAVAVAESAAPDPDPDPDPIAAAEAASDAATQLQQLLETDPAVDHTDTQAPVSAGPAQPDRQEQPSDDPSVEQLDSQLADSAEALLAEGLDADVEPSGHDWPTEPSTPDAVDRAAIVQAPPSPVAERPPSSQPADDTVAEPAPQTAPTSTATPDASHTPSSSPGLIATLHGGLRKLPGAFFQLCFALNAPVRSLDAQWRQIIGYAGLITLANACLLLIIALLMR